MNASSASSASSCGVPSYLTLCASSKVLLLLPALVLNLLVLASAAACKLGPRAGMRNDVAAFIFGSASCNLLGLGLWPMTIHWKQHGRWLLGRRLCEVMVSVKHLSSSASFHYVSLITFSIYLTVACGCRRLVDSRLFLTLQLLSPLLPVALTELTLWLLGSRVDHLDPVKLTCFSFINDRVLRGLLLAKIAVFFPLNLYFYAHVLHTLGRSAKLTRRSQRVNARLAKMFGLIASITFAAHAPGAVFALLNHPSVCQEMVRDLVLDLPLLSSPVILLRMNKELRNQCMRLLRRDSSSHYTEGQERSAGQGSGASAETEMMSV